jgi:multidrug efflux system membrane fusion protein
MRVDQARAAVQGLEAKLSLTADQVASQTSKADAAARGVGSAEAQRSLASSTLGRMEPLLGPGFVTAQQVDQARTAQRTAQIALQQARLQADEARQAIINTKPTEAELEGARATLALAERDLNKTVVRAPCDGRITALDIAAGEFAATGHPLFTIIDTEHWYAIGNFRETDLAGMEPGQRATVYVMAQPSRPLRGRVESLGWGVASDVSATVGGLPHVERTLNWVRIAARFPVRVLLDAPPDDLMRYGATARWTKAMRATSLHCCAASCVRPPAGSATVCALSSSSSPLWRLRKRFASLKLPFRATLFCSYRVARQSRRS